MFFAGPGNLKECTKGLTNNSFSGPGLVVPCIFRSITNNVLKDPGNKIGNKSIFKIPFGLVLVLILSWVGNQ